jgi:hypothetical protein
MFLGVHSHYNQKLSTKQIHVYYFCAADKANTFSEIVHLHIERREHKQTPLCSRIPSVGPSFSALHHPW